MQHISSKYLRVMASGLAAAVLSACGGGGGGGASPPAPAPPAPLIAPAAPVVTSAMSLKQMTFSWTQVPGATSYRLLRNADGASGFTQVGGDLAAGSTSASLDVAAHLVDWLNARYQIQACNAAGCTSSADQAAMTGYQQSIGIFKASNAAGSDNFFIVALSRDGQTMAVGAPAEDGGSQTINGDQTSDTLPGSGAVYVFTRAASGQWSQQAYVKAANAGPDDLFGRALALSADGNTLAVGAVGEDSFATGVDGNGLDNTMGSSGAAYVFTRANGAWTQQAYVKASNTGESDGFGAQVALSADGNALAVSAPAEASAASGINGGQNNDLADLAGAVYVFARAGAAWAQTNYIKASNAGSGRSFGDALALSSDGHTLAVSATEEGSNATGVNGNQSNNNAPGSGAVYVFSFDTAWTQQAYVKATRSSNNLHFGTSVALSGDGNVLAVGAIDEDSAAAGIDGNQVVDPLDLHGTDSGAVYLYTRAAGVWQPQHYFKASNTGSQDQFGFSVALDDLGNTLIVGAIDESSNTVGINGNQADDTSTHAGAAYVFRLTGGQWTQRNYLKALVTNSIGHPAYFGYSLGLSGDANTLAIGVASDSAATGIGGPVANDHGASGAGAVLMY